MAQLISEIWEGLRDAGLPEVMLYLPDNSASRCHWDDTTTIGDTRVALLADQERQIVRILPVDSCVGIGIASPKGVDPSGYKRVIFNRLVNGPDESDDAILGGEETPIDVTPPAPVVAPSAPTPPPPPPSAAPPPPKPDPLASRFGVAMKPAVRYQGGAPYRGA